MKVIIRDTNEEASDWIAMYVAKKVNDFKPGPDRYFVLGVSMNCTALGVFSKLVELFVTGKISFQFVKLFNLEEYVNLPDSHPESYHYKMWRYLYRSVNILPANVFIPDGNVKDLVAECKNFEKSIKDHGGFELFIGEISPSGQLSFNEIGSSLGSRTRVKNLSQDSKKERAWHFDNDINKVPQRAISGGVATIMESRKIVLFASGVETSIALYKAIEEGINHMVILSIFQKHPHTYIVCDKYATLELKRKTIEYFSSLDNPINYSSK